MRNEKKEIIHRRIYPNDVTYLQKCRYPYIQNHVEGIDENVKDNNIINNNINTHTVSKEKYLDNVFLYEIWMYRIIKFVWRK